MYKSMFTENVPVEKMLTKMHWADKDTLEAVAVANYLLDWLGPSKRGYSITTIDSVIQLAYTFGHVSGMKEFKDSKEYDQKVNEYLEALNTGHEYEDGDGPEI